MVYNETPEHFLWSDNYVMKCSIICVKGNNNISWYYRIVAYAFKLADYRNVSPLLALTHKTLHFLGIFLIEHCSYIWLFMSPPAPAPCWLCLNTMQQDWWVSKLWDKLFTLTLYTSNYYVLIYFIHLSTIRICIKISRKNNLYSYKKKIRHN